VAFLVDRPVRGRLGAATLRRLDRRVRRMVRAAGLAEPAPAGPDLELEVTTRLTDDATIRELNRAYRGRDRPTDVLAFSQREGEGGDLHPHLLGDIVISLETAARQARRGLEREVLFLAAHGLCHLLGHDHKTDAEEAEMNRRMGALLRESARSGPVRPA